MFTRYLRQLAAAHAQEGYTILVEGGACSLPPPLLAVLDRWLDILSFGIPLRNYMTAICIKVENLQVA